MTTNTRRYDRINSLLLTDFYKFGHRFQYPKGTQVVYSNFTPRGSRLPGVDRMVFFGLQYFLIEYLERRFTEDFFDRPRAEVMDEYVRFCKATIGGLPSYDHVEHLHYLGRLPLHFRALREGSLVPMRIPCLTVVNTDDDFAWLTNYIETLTSSVLWQPCTSATIAHEYRKLLDAQAAESGMDPAFVSWQAHDFSFRGMGSPEAALTSGMGHLLSFTGTDTAPAIWGMEEYYGANLEEELVGGSVAATEHSVMCAGGSEDELGTYRRLLTDVYPTGIVSIVSDTWDLWHVLTSTLPELKREILARPGKCVIRPDSGNPVDIICGTDPESTQSSTPAEKGVVQCLWETFGGTTTPRGYNLLNEHVGTIYGDSITLARAKEIGERLMAKGFAPQCVYGVGSYTYQYNTRDTFGTAIKSTWVQIDGVGKPIFKAPKTDAGGVKNSARGLLSVLPDYTLLEGDANAPGNLLRSVWTDGHWSSRQTLSEIRQHLRDQTAYWAARRASSEGGVR